MGLAVPAKDGRNFCLRPDAMKLTIDFETRSDFDLKKGGAWAYSEDPSTMVNCLALKWEGQSPMMWIPYYWQMKLTNEQKSRLPLVGPAYVKAAIADATTIEAHNMSFEQAIWRNAMSRHGFDDLPVNKLRCSAAKAAAHALPRALGNACEALRLPQQKDMTGYHVMLKMCKPRKTAHGMVYHEDAEDFITLCKYCLQDVVAEEQLSAALPDLSPSELAVFQLDALINARGLAVDVDACRAAVTAIEDCTKELINEFQRLSGGKVLSPKQVAALRGLLAKEHGIELPDLKKRTVKDAIGDSEGAARRMLEIRQSLSKSSTAKFTAMLNAASRDGRVRGTLLYHGANTGRWSGRLIQPQNFPRDSFKTEADTDRFIADIRECRLALLDMLYGDPMAAFSKLLRGCIIAGPGKELMAADLSAIEGRGLAWIAGEDSALQVYRDGLDPYIINASNIYGTEYAKVVDKQRQVGKVVELSAGYAGGVKAFDGMAANYGLVIEQEEEKKRIIKAWRENRPMTVKFWKDTEECAATAMWNKGDVVVMPGGRVKWLFNGKTLKVRLPSGRLLCYNQPYFAPVKTPFGERIGLWAYCVDERGRWSAFPTYGGLFTNNIVQGFCRDIMATNMLRAEAAGYPLVLTVHDETVSEIPFGFGSVKEFEGILATVPAWAPGLPLVAKGWRGRRYRK